MKYNFCTLFDKNYVFQGLALYESLEKYCPDFQIFILCLDDETYNLLVKLKLSHSKLVKLSEIESRELLEAKANRSRGEYCWTLASVFTYFLLKNKPELDDIAYLDSDIYFYSSPGPIYQELGDKSILIIKHNYPEKLRYLEKNGVYNVAMVIFKNNAAGLACLEWWQAEVIKWCYNRCEDGKFGDQAYLDDWTTRFQGVHVLSHPGGNVAPWNLNNYKVDYINQSIKINQKNLIFYHFHTFKILEKNKFQKYSSFYSFNKKTESLIYNLYIENIKKNILKVNQVDPFFNGGYRSGEKLISIIKQKIKKLLVNINFLYQKYGKKD